MKLRNSWVAIIFLLAILPSISFAKTNEGKTIRLESYTGSVSIETGAEKTVKIMNKMRLFDGYTVTTAKDATAYLSIDNKKSIRLDQNTKVSIVKKDNINEIQVISGSIFFSVKEKLKDDETLDVVTPTMAIGIRGTTGTVFVKREESCAQIYSGRVTVKNKRGNEKTVAPGQEVRDSKSKEKNLEVIELKRNGEEIPSFSLNEINKDKEIKQQISEVQIFEVEKFVETEKVNKEKEKVEFNEEQQKIEGKKEEAKNQKKENTIEITKEEIVIIKEEVKENVGTEENKEDENKELQEEYELINKGETVNFENTKGNLYVFEVDEETGTAKLKDTINFSEELKIENSANGEIKVTEDNKSNSLSGTDYNGAYKIVE